MSKKELNFWHDNIIYASVPDGFMSFLVLHEMLLMITTINYYNLKMRLSCPVFKRFLFLVILGYLIGDGKDSLLIWGDIVHLSHLQMAQPEITIAFDSNTNGAAAVHATLFDRVVTN